MKTVLSHSLRPHAARFLLLPTAHCSLLTDLWCPRRDSNPNQQIMSFPRPDSSSSTGLIGADPHVNGWINKDQFLKFFSRISQGGETRLYLSVKNFSRAMSKADQ